MNVLHPAYVQSRGYRIEHCSPGSGAVSSAPFDYGHYHKDEYDSEAKEHGVAIISRHVSLGSPDADVPQLAAIVPFGRWSRYGRYNSSFESADSELKLAFRSLKETVSAWSGQVFHATEPYPEQVKVDVFEDTDGIGIGCNKQFVLLERRGSGILADQRAVGVGLVLGERTMLLPVNKQRSERVLTVAHNVAHTLNEVLATEVVE